MILSVQQPPYSKNNEKKEEKKEKKEEKSLNIENIKDKNKENNQKEEYKLFKDFIIIIELIRTKFEEALKEIENLNIERNGISEIKEELYKIKDSIINRLNEVIDYMSQPSINASNINNNPLKIENNKSEPSPSSRPSIGSTNEKNFNFQEQITSIKLTDDSKLFGLKKRLAFRIAQMKIFYNEMRSFIYYIKLYIIGISFVENNDSIFPQNPNNLTQEEKKTFIEYLIDEYIADGKTKIYKNEDKNEDNLELYLKMLDTLIFFEEKPNEYSNIIKENDLSSIIYYGISSNTYKTYMKEKTNLLEYKNIENNKTTEKEKKDSLSKKLNKELYKTLFIFDPEKVNEKKKNTRLEAEILNKESLTSLQIQIKSITKKKFYPDVQSRKQTISIPVSITNSPGAFSPKKIDDEIEKKLDLIEEKITGFFFKLKNEIKTPFKELKNKVKDKYINTLVEMTVEEFSNYLKGFSIKYNTNINNEADDKEKKKKILFDNFIASFDKIKANQKVPFKLKSDPGKEKLKDLKLIEEDKENFEENNLNSNLNLNIIDFIGNLNHLEDSLQNSEIDIKIFFPRQFEALRIVYCSTYEDLLASMLESQVWNVSGGKSKATFYKTRDDKYLFKSIKESEFNMFIEMAPHYFQHMGEYLFHKMPSLLTKTLGVFNIVLKKEFQKDENYYLMMMENLNYGLNLKEIKSYDLKGSLSNRYILKENQKPNTVLHDSNFKEEFKNEPIPLKKKIYDLLNIAVYNDTFFLSKIGVVDYSLLLHIYKNPKNNVNYLRMGLIDYVRKYTWDKQLEHVIKIILKGVTPTIVEPKDYKKRFKDAFKDYFIGI